MSPPSLSETGILDANGIIGLAKSGCLPLISRLFDRVYVPPLVVREVVDPVSAGELRTALGTWLTEVAPSPSALQQVPALSRSADRHVLALALDHQRCGIVTGDRRLTNRATAFGVFTIAPEEVIRVLAETGLIVAAKPHLDQMMRLGFSIPDKIYDGILRRLGEAQP